MKFDLVYHQYHNFRPLQKKDAIRPDLKIYFKTNWNPILASQHLALLTSKHSLV